MLTWGEVDRRADQLAQLRKDVPLTPGHSAAEGEVGAGDRDDEAARRRDRVRHEAEPYPDEVPEVDLAELGKRFRPADAAVAGYPAPCRVDPEEFRRGPIVPGRAAYSPGYEVGRPVPVPSETLSPGMACRPLLSDGRARPGAPGGT